MRLGHVFVLVVVVASRHSACYNMHAGASGLVISVIVDGCDDDGRKFWL